MPALEEQVHPKSVLQGSLLPENLTRQGMHAGGARVWGRAWGMKSSIRAAPRMASMNFWRTPLNRYAMRTCLRYRWRRMRLRMVVGKITRTCISHEFHLGDPNLLFMPAQVSLPWTGREMQQMHQFGEHQGFCIWSIACDSSPASTEQGVSFKQKPFWAHFAHVVQTSGKGGSRGIQCRPAHRTPPHY